MLDTKKISNLSFKGIKLRFNRENIEEAFVSEADYDGKPMTEDELEDLNTNHSEWVYEKLIDHIF
jgi:hypothetical protein